MMLKRQGQLKTWPKLRLTHKHIIALLIYMICTSFSEFRIAGLMNYSCTVINYVLTT